MYHFFFTDSKVDKHSLQELPVRTSSTEDRVHITYCISSLSYSIYCSSVTGLNRTPSLNSYLLHC